MSDDIDGVAPATPTPVRLDTPHARDMLRKRFDANEWAFMEEVAPQTGGGTGYADAVAVNLWASRGHAIHGFEIKVSRSDWLRELKKPAKAESVFAYCDRWWIVAPKGVLKEEELPPTWGYYELRETGLISRVEAPKLKPKPIDRGFFASIVRRSNDTLERVAESKARLAMMKARDEFAEQVEREVRRRTLDHSELASRVANFEKETGLKLDRWSGPPTRIIKLAQTLEHLIEYGDFSMQGRLESLAKGLTNAAETVLKASAEFHNHKESSNASNS